MCRGFEMECNRRRSISAAKFNTFELIQVTNQAGGKNAGHMNDVLPIHVLFLGYVLTEYMKRRIE